MKIRMTAMVTAIVLLVSLNIAAPATVFAENSTRGADTGASQRVKYVCASSWHRAALMENGDLYCWGYNAYGQVGNGTQKDQLTPVKVLEDVVSVDLGSNHSAAITSNGDLYCWGWNAYGQVGNGEKAQGAGWSTPVTMPEKVLENVKYISLTSERSAAITTNGDLYCWGVITYSYCSGNTCYSYCEVTPQKVLENVKSISLESVHSAAITTNGDLYCWGWNDNGQVGNGTTNVQKTPEKVMENVQSVSMSGSHSAAITTNRDLYCWGYNYSGQVGNGTLERYQTTPVKVLGDVKSFSVGVDSSTAITTNGNLYCWGNNNFGQVGNGNLAYQRKPEKVLENVEYIFSRRQYHKAALKTNSDLYCWGQNNHGQVGNGTTKQQNMPVRVLGNVAVYFTGYHHSAAIATNGDLYCWGENDYGQVGNGTTEDQLTPAKVLENVSVYSSGTAITANGNLYCWGRNNYGQVGNGTTENQTTPVKILGSAAPDDDMPTSSPSPTASFNQYIYRADHLTDPSKNEGATMETYMNYDTPSEIMVRELQKNGFANTANAWKAVTRTCDTALDASKIADYTVEEKDIYQALILNALETAAQYDVIDTINADAIKDANELIQLIKSDLKIKYSLEVYENTKNSTLTQEMRVRVKELAEEYYEEKKLSKAAGWLDKFEDVMGHLDTIENFCEEVTSYINIRNMNDSMKKVLKEMKSNCQSNNKALSDALDDCVSVLNASDSEFEKQMIQGGLKTVGVEAAKAGVSKFWSKIVVAKIESMRPEVVIIKAAYKTAKCVTNLVFNTDEITEKYYKMIAATELDLLGRNTYTSLRGAYTGGKNIENAKAYLSAIDVMFNVIGSDCDSAYAYVDSLSSANLSKICKLFNCGNDYASSKASIENIQKNQNLEHESVLTSWIDSLLEDYPAEYAHYTKLFEESAKRIKEYQIHCPVDVYVRDSSGDLAASVVNNVPSSSKLAVLVDGDEKTFYLPEGEFYSFDYIGNGTGTMDIEIAEYDADSTLLRNINFNDLTLVKGTKYSSDENGKFLESAEYSIISDDNSKRAADFDSYAQEEKGAYEISIEQGTIFNKGVPAYTIKAHENEVLDISAYIPDGYELDFWKVTSGSIEIRDIKKASTKAVVGNGNAAIKAILKKTASGAEDGTASSSENETNKSDDTTESGSSTQQPGNTTGSSVQTPEPGSTAADKPLTPTQQNDNTVAATNVPAVGSKWKDAKGNTYKIIKSGKSKGEVEFIKAKSKKIQTASIPATVKIKGATYKVTSIAAKAFKGNTKLRKATIGSNVGKIGKQAFYKCKNLKAVTIKTAKLTKKSIGTSAFKNINAKAKIKVPKKKLSSYKKFLKKAGIGKRVRVQK